jgi:hypothetical protein
MSKLKYHQAFTRLTTLSLLHLYCYIDTSSRFMPIKKRNDLLVKCLKKYITSPDNAIIKKDIKTLIIIAKKGQNVEKKLWDLHKVNNQYGEKFTDADHLFILFTYLYEEHGFESVIDTDDVERKKSVIYTDRELIDASFTDEHVLITPLPIFIIMDEPSLLVALINGHGGMFTAEYVSTCMDSHCAKLLIHRAKSD